MRGLGAAELGDRERLAVLLQGVGLLAHLRRVDLRLARGWRDLRVSSAGLLEGVEVERGADPRLPQERALALLFALFEPERPPRSPARPLAGRGEGRRIARRLQQGWFQSLYPIAHDRLVADVLEQAPFLWSSRFAVARTALAGERLDGRGRALWVAGPAVFRRRILERGRDWMSLRQLLLGEEVQRLWFGNEGHTARELAERGAWSEAVALWSETPPAEPAERRSRAAALWQLGRFEDVIDALGRLATFSDRLLRLRCRAALNQWRAAARELAALEAAKLDAERLLAVAPTALRVLANLGQRPRLEEWRERVLAAAFEAGESARGARIAAWASWDLRQYDAMERHLEESAESVAGEAAAESDWAHARGLLECSRGRPGEGVRWIERSLRAAARARPASFELGRLWNDLVFARVLAGDLGGAERAAGHAYRRLWRCDGPLPVVLALSNLAEIRIRRGRLRGVREILERVQQENEAAGNVRARIQDLALEARFHLATGELEAALETVARADAELEGTDPGWHREEIDTLAARALGWLGRAQAAAERLERGVDVQLLEPEERPALFWLADLPERALEQAGQLETAAQRSLWSAVIEGESAGEELLSPVLDRLEPYRGARLLLDLQLGGVEVPEPRRRQACWQLSRLGAEGPASVLDPGDDRVWRRLADWLDAPGDDAERALRLLAEVAPGVRLVRRSGDGRVESLLEGRGGDRRLRFGRDGCSVELESQRIEARTRVLFTLVAPALLTMGEVDDAGPEDRARERSPRSWGLIGRSPALVSAVGRLAQFAGEPLPLLVEGETGTGKELAARFVHARSPRRERAFQSVNCAALPNENLLLSALFGHARGAFTGADRSRTGAFEAADGGTLFLDEIGDLPAAAQGTLLRALEEGEIVRLGETRARPVDVRVVAATHRDLRTLVAQGRFREDLYYRLRVTAVALPPLRERAGDIELLAEHFAARQPGAPRLAPAAIERLLRHRWPGNVRELRSVVEAAAVLARTEEGQEGRSEIALRHLDLPEGATAAAGSYHDRVEAFRRRLLEEALERHDGNQAAAARELGLSRQALSYLVRSLGLRRR